MEWNAHSSEQWNNRRYEGHYLYVADERWNIFFISCPVTNVRAGCVGGLNSNYVALQMTIGLLVALFFYILSCWVVSTRSFGNLECHIHLLVMKWATAVGLGNHWYSYMHVCMYVHIHSMCTGYYLIFVLIFIRGDFIRDGLVTRNRCVSTDGEWHLPF